MSADTDERTSGHAEQDGAAAHTAAYLWMTRLRAACVVTLVVGMSWLFIYNSGIGYDALEVLFIARSLSDGQPFYSYPPAKPVGIYALTSALYLGGRPVPHWAVAGLVLALWAAATGAGWAYARRWFGPACGRLAAALIGVAGLFMELNFLVVEGVVAAAGFAALDFLARYDRGRRLRWVVAAGAVLGLAFHFKQTAALYALGAGVWLALLSPRREIPARWLALLGGWLGAVAPLVAYFGLTGRIGSYYEWTIAMPAATPASTEYLAKALVKLGWILAAIAAALGASVAVPSIREFALRDRNVWALGCFGVPSLYPLVKSQAPHYVFPAAVMGLAFSAVVFGKARVAIRRRSGGAGGGRWAGAAATALVLGVAASTLAYRPAVILRLTTIRDFGAERETAEGFRRALPPSGRVLFLGPDPLSRYVVTGRYPPTGVAFHTDSQTEYVLARDADNWLRALDDATLVAVEYDSERPPEIRFDRLAAPERGLFWQRFYDALRARFRVSDDAPAGCVVWVRRGP